MREIADSESEGGFSSSPPPESPVKPPENGFILPAIPDPTPIDEARKRDEQLPSELEGVVEIPTQKDTQLSEAHGDLMEAGKSDFQNDGKVPDSGEEIQQAIAVAHAALIAPSSCDTVPVATCPLGSNPLATQIQSHAFSHPVNPTGETTSSADYLAHIWESRAVSAVSGEVGGGDVNKKDCVDSGDLFVSIDAAVVEQLPVPSVELPPSAVKKGEYEVFSEDAAPPSPSLPPQPRRPQIDEEKSTDLTHRKDMEIYELPDSDDIPPPAKRSRTTKPVESNDAAVTLDNQDKPKDAAHYPDPALPQPSTDQKDIFDIGSSSPPRVKKRSVSSAILEAARKKRRALTNLARPTDTEDLTDEAFSEKPERQTPQRTKTEIPETAEAKRKKRKSLNDLTIPPADHSSDSDFVGGPTPARKKSKKVEIHQESPADMAEDNTSTKSTRINTGEAGLVPPLPKPKRKRDLTKELTDFLPLPDAKDATTGRAAKERSRTEVDPYSIEEADFLAQFRIASEWRAAKGKKPSTTQQPLPLEVFSDGELGSKGNKEKKRKEQVKKARGMMSLEDMLEPTPAELQLQQENAGTISRPHSALPSRQNSGYNSPADYHTPPLGAVAPVAPMMSFAPPPPPPEMSAEAQQMQPVQDSYFPIAEQLPSGAESLPSAESVVPPPEDSSVPEPVPSEAQAIPAPPHQDAQPPLPPPKQPAPPESPSRLAKRSYTKARFVADSDDEMDSPLSDVPASTEMAKKPVKEKIVKEKKTPARKKTALPKDPEDDASAVDTTPGSAGKRKRGDPEGLDAVDELNSVDAPVVQPKKRSPSKKKVNEEVVVDDAAAPTSVMEAVEVPIVEAPKKKGRTSTKSRKAQEALRAQEAQEAADLAAAIEASLAESAGAAANVAQKDEPSGDVEAAPVSVESVEVMEAVEVEAPKKKGRTNTRTRTKKGAQAAETEAIVDVPTVDPVSEEVSVPEAVTPAPKKRSNTGRGRKKKEPTPPPEPEPEPEAIKESTPEPEKSTTEKSFSTARESTVSKKDEADEEPRTPAPDSPSKKKASKPTHSPIKRSAKVPFRVGLSKRARIEPLLTIRRPTKPA
ncbi:hypothetical protein BZA77DRAFT_304191 [Pyronema omphalodes]|nr:hypothetical protein BZA77DRAFT_304191 [Pyronema omphalodes]